MEEILKNISDFKLSCDNKESANKECPCGYHPSNSTNKLVCNVKLALQNHLTFPSFEMLSDLYYPSLTYYNYDIIRSTFIPKRHWAFLIEIEYIFNLIRPRCYGFTRFGEKVGVHFYHEFYEQPISFSWKDFTPGNTMAILYAERKTFLDMSEGIRQENLDLCYIFKANIQDVFKEANKLLNDADLKSKNECLECFGCGLKTSKIFRCSSCHLAKYCSKECQTNEWKSVHKKLCKQSGMLLRLSCLPRYNFSDFYSFNQIWIDKIPEYKPMLVCKKKKSKKKGLKN